MKKILWPYLVLTPAFCFATWMFAESKMMARMNSWVSPSVTSSVSKLDQPLSLPLPSANISSPIPALKADAISYKVCGELKQWQRPTTTEQQAKLQSSPRYHSINPVTLQSQLEILRNQQIFLVTNYGLSALMDRLYLTGLWSVPESVYQSCYQASQIQKLNQSNIAEIWLINHKVKKITWRNNTYLVTVEPTQKGVQFIQLERQEQGTKLPIQIVDDQGKPLMETQNPAFASVWQSSQSSAGF